MLSTYNIPRLLVGTNISKTSHAPDEGAAELHAAALFFPQRPGHACGTAKYSRAIDSLILILADTHTPGVGADGVAVRAAPRGGVLGPAGQQQGGRSGFRALETVERGAVCVEYGDARSAGTCVQRLPSRCGWVVLSLSLLSMLAPVGAGVLLLSVPLLWLSGKAPVSLPFSAAGKAQMEAKFVRVRGLWRPPSSLPPSSLLSLLPLDGFGSPYPTVATGHFCVFQNNV